MAQIVFGVGCSHSPLLATKAEQWDLRANDDRHNPAHPYRGKVYKYDDLVQLRAGENLAEQVKIEVRRKRDARNQECLALLADRIKAANLDVLVVIGDDQHEVLHGDNMPAFMVFTGKEIPFKPTSPEKLASMTEGVRVANWARVPEREMSLPGPSDLAAHVVRSVVAEHYDVSVADHFRERKGAESGIGHAFGFFYHRLMNDFAAMPRLATLPVFINTFFAPNQPSVKRCYDFGRALGRALAAWPGNARIGIAASGGFSHFVIDEELDRRLLGAIERNDINLLLAEPEAHFQSGTSEIKNWIAAVGALEGSGLKFELVDYVPCYRSPAGTGNAMTFALWR